MNSKILNGNALKIIASASMLIDHIGFIFFPDYMFFRVLGRIAFPIFAFMIAEGAKYTKNKVKHFFIMFLLGAICQAVYFIADVGIPFLCILITFSISTLLIYVLQKLKRVIFSKYATTCEKIFWCIVFFCGIIGAYFLNWGIEMDYGFIGCLTPVFASLFDFKDINVPNNFKKLDNVYARILCLIPPLIILISTSNLGAIIQAFALFSIPILFLYSEKRGTPKLKYFFYIFYPLHLAILYGIGILIAYIK